MYEQKVVARNTAVDSDNKIHDDNVAQRFGFTGGLVPGVDVYAYLTRGPVALWGVGWLRGGAIDVSFRSPTYDGETVTVEFDETTGEVRLRNPAGSVVSSGTAQRVATLPVPNIDDERYALTPIRAPADRPTASPESLAVGTVLGTVEQLFLADEADAYLASVNETLDIYARDRIAHPGSIARLANRILVANVRLGPWMHVGSRVTNHSVVPDGALVSCRGVVAKEYDRKGHRFVELDVAIFADDLAAASIWHTAIYLPRQVSEAG